MSILSLTVIFVNELIPSNCFHNRHLTKFFFLDWIPGYYKLSFTLLSIQTCLKNELLVKYFSLDKLLRVTPLSLRFKHLILVIYQKNKVFWKMRPFSPVRPRRTFPVVVWSCWTRLKKAITKTLTTSSTLDNYLPWLLDYVYTPSNQSAHCSAWSFHAQCFCDRQKST